MDQRTALRKLQKMLGPKVGYKINDKALDAESRAEARARAVALKVELDAAKQALEARFAELMRDPTYRALKEAHRQADAAYNAERYRAECKRIQVVVSSGIFYEVKAGGDNWQQVVDAVEADA